MRRVARAVGVMVSALMAGGIGATPPAATEGVTQLKDGPGHDLTVAQCVICHSLEYIPSNAPAMNRPAWQKTIQKMKERYGAPLTDAQARQILEYLAANYSGNAP